MSSQTVDSAKAKLDNVAEKAKQIASPAGEMSALSLYSRVAFAGAIGCAATHGGLTPVDVVKTRIQLDPAKYRNGMVGTFRQIIAEEGAGALLTGLGPTAAGYFLQGAFKFGGYELFKQKSIDYLGYESAQRNRIAVYSVSAGTAEVFASIALCPLEATRIRLVSTPGFANGLIGGFGKILSQEGIGAFYSGFGPILFKQVPYTITKFVAYEKFAEAIYANLVDKTTASAGTQTGVNLGAGLLAGFAAAIVSQPADTMLSKINKVKAEAGEGTVSRLIKIAGELGVRGAFGGLGTRLFMVGTLTAGQFALFGDIKKALGAKTIEISKA